MPTYDYECEACGGRFELRQGMRDAPAAECPSCGGKVRRLIGGGAGVIIKGGGRGAGGCSLDSAGATCCGREERCGKPCGRAE
jgi:putative FmdB family regulatory protein